MNRAFVVLGMHRSGTSAITRTLNLLGLFLPADRMLRPAADNPLGNWEHAGIMRAHDEFFAKFGYRHYGPIGPWSDDVWHSPWVVPLESALREILQQDFMPHTSWVVKDPRMCRLLPVWLPLLERMGAEASFLLMARNPMEVAASLRVREHLPDDLSHWLWLGHVLESEFLTRGRPRVFVTYDELLRDWPRVVALVAERLRFELPSHGEAATAVTTFLRAELRHHTLALTSADDASLPRRLSSRLWQALQAPQAADETWLKAQCDRIRGEWRDSLTSPLGRSLSTLVEQCYGRAVDAVKAGVDNERHLQSILLSRSWRLTAPLRIIHSRTQRSSRPANAGAAAGGNGSSYR